jgi:aminoglycoside phosphotransferase (APT) family kinase protein
VVTGVPAWPEVRAVVARELGQPLDDARPLTPARRSRMTWAARGPRTGPIVVKVRDGADGAEEKTRWCAAYLPALAGRGYPVPAIWWHGRLGSGWHVTVQSQLPGRPLRALDRPMLDAALGLVELQADAGIPPGRGPVDRDFTGYVAHVLFDDWDDQWAGAAQAGPGADLLCRRLRAWLQPVWGLRLPAADYAHNDLNLSNILTDGTRITGVVDWDEFGLGSRALDLVTLAADGQRGGNHAATGQLLAQAARVAGDGGLRCLVSYRAIASLAHSYQERESYGNGLADEECAAFTAILDRLQAPGRP